MSAQEHPWTDELPQPPGLPLEAAALSLVGWGILAFYVVAQGLLLVALNDGRWLELKLCLETYLLLLGLILHIQWRQVERILWEAGLPRPWWLKLADCLSFVTTFSACGTLTYLLMA